MKREISEKTSPSLRAIAGAWFLLTERERKILIIALLLAILGLVSRYWHLSREQADEYHLPESTQIRN